MAELGENMEEVYNEFDNQVDRINCLIKEFMELKETINRYKKNRYYWELHYSTLSMNIWSGQVKYVELQKKEADLRTAISETTKVTDSKEQELKSLTVQRTIYFSEQCDKFRSKSIKYTDNFLCAQKKYSNENLLKDIERYRKEYEQILQELPVLKKKLTNLEMLCNLNCWKSKGENEGILKINVVLVDIIKHSNNKLLKIESAQDMLKKLENGMKQKKMMLNNFLNK